MDESGVELFPVSSELSHEEDAVVDKISNLPDSILCHMHPLLPSN